MFSEEGNSYNTFIYLKNKHSTFGWEKTECLFGAPLSNSLNQDAYCDLDIMWHLFNLINNLRINLTLSKLVIYQCPAPC